MPFSRGRERSLPASEIVRQVVDLKERGVKEVHLIGQNVNSYRPETDAGLEGYAREDGILTAACVPSPRPVSSG